MAQSLLWYDLETYGLNANSDRIASFAAVRTDRSFNIIDEPITLYARPTSDYLPNPGAVFVNRLSPLKLLECGLREQEMARIIFEQFSRSGTCIAGFNNIRFDDEFIRRLFYRNFFDIYNHAESRWDIIDLVLACHDLRPEGIVWPQDENGRFTFRLEALTAANSLPHVNPHEALSDVYATINVTKLLHGHQSRLVEFHFNQRDKNRIRRYINLEAPEPFIHTSRMLMNDEGQATGIVLPLMADPDNPGKIYVYDLRHDPELFLSLSPEEAVRRYFTSRDQLPDDRERIHIKGLQPNKCPAVFPLSVFTADCEKRLRFTKSEALSRAARLIGEMADVREKVFAIARQMNAHYEGEEPLRDVDFLIYKGGFFNYQEKRVFEIIRNTPPEELTTLNPQFNDPRSPVLFKRYIGRNFPEVLDEKGREEWRKFCADRLTFPPSTAALSFNDFRMKIGELSRTAESPEELRLLNELFEYGRRLEKTLLKSIKAFKE
jgi:exodeoxyribonuclease-1